MYYNNLFSIEDSVCAGALIQEIIKLQKEVTLSDSARGALALNSSFGKNKLNILTESEHGKILAKNGFLKDLEFCSAENSTNIVPYYINSALKALD